MCEPGTLTAPALPWPELPRHPYTGSLVSENNQNRQLVSGDCPSRQPSEYVYWQCCGRAATRVIRGAATGASSQGESMERLGHLSPYLEGCILL